MKEKAPWRVDVASMDWTATVRISSESGANENEKSFPFCLKRVLSYPPKIKLPKTSFNPTFQD